MILENKMIDKSYRACKRSRLFGLLLLALAAVLLIFACVNTFSKVRNMEHLNDVIVAKEGERFNKVAYLDMVGFMQFATYGDDVGYYVAYDDDFYYLIKMKDKDFDYVADKFDTQEYVRVYGYTEEFPAEGKSYAIEMINEEIGEEYVTYANFDDVFGDVVLSVERDNKVRGFTSLFTLNSVPFIGGLLAAFFGGLLTFINGSALKSFEKYKNSEDPATYNLAKEINSEDTRTYEKLGLIMGNDHLISTANNLQVIDYNDIHWAYLTNHRTNGVQDYNFLNICTNDGQRIVCGSGNTFGKKNRTATSENHQEILEFISAKNPETRIGYLQEHIDDFAQLVKDNKNKNKQ